MAYASFREMSSEMGEPDKLETFISREKEIQGQRRVTSGSEFRLWHKWRYKYKFKHKKGQKSKNATVKHVQVLSCWNWLILVFDQRMKHGFIPTYLHITSSANPIRLSMSRCCTKKHMYVGFCLLLGYMLLLGYILLLRLQQKQKNGKLLTNWMFK
ncbi:unnamed protein product [Cochlearia groenlandica]